MSRISLRKGFGCCQKKRILFSQNDMNVPNGACSGLMKTGETNGRGHWRPRGGLGVPAHEATSEHKKSRTLPHTR